MTVTHIPPTAAFDPPQFATAGDPTYFYAQDGGGEGTIVSWAWNFGDGTSASGPYPAHVYAAPGTYAVTLTVTADDGLTSTVSHPVTVQ